MDRITAKMESDKKNLQEFLQAAIGNFHIGNDTEGMDDLFKFLEKLEYEVEADWPQMDLDQLLPVLRELYFFIKNQDIVGMTDLLEGKVVSLTKKMLKGCDEA